jgi:hypothetical protein
VACFLFIAVGRFSLVVVLPVGIAIALVAAFREWL